MFGWNYIVLTCWPKLSVFFNIYHIWMYKQWIISCIWSDSLCLVRHFFIVIGWLPQFTEWFDTSCKSKTKLQNLLITCLLFMAGCDDRRIQKSQICRQNGKFENPLHLIFLQTTVRETGTFLRCTLHVLLFQAVYGTLTWTCLWIGNMKSYALSWGLRQLNIQRDTKSPSRVKAYITQRMSQR